MIEYENLHKTNQHLLKDYQKAFTEVFDSGWFVLGMNVKKFEEEFATYCNTSHCVGLSSGLEALQLGLKAFNFPKGSEVIAPSNTYIATILSILHNDLQPVLVEPDLKTYNIDESLIEQKITSKTVAIIPVHLYGKCCRMDRIMELAQRYSLKIIEDAAQAHGATFKGQKAGSFGDIGAFSFYPTKNLGALGDAGGVITNNMQLASSLKMLRNYGSQKKYYNDKVGFNARLDEIQAAFLRLKLKKIEEINSHKKKLAQIYLKELNNDFIKPVVHPDYEDVYHIFAIRHPKRNKLRKYLLKNKIKTDIHYPIPPNKQKAMQGILSHIATPLAQKIHDTILSLPIAYFHTEDDIYKVITVLNKF